jgi:putative tryptophan/tyrosine transport system substrate-binding protein
MKPPSTLGLAVLCVLVATISADAQQPAKVWHLGILSGEPPTESLPVVTPFLEELRKLGYAEGQNLAIEWRWAEAREQKLPALAGELVQRQSNGRRTRAGPRTAG